MKPINIKLVKTQSILEYILAMTAIFIMVLIGTVGLKTGIQNNNLSDTLEGGLDSAQGEIDSDYIRRTEPSDDVVSQDYFSSPQEFTSDSEWEQAGIHEGGDTYDGYGGPEYNTNQYYYHEGESDMSYVPTPGKVIDSDTSFVAPPVAN